jgi:hypothetical protein
MAIGGINGKKIAATIATWVIVYGLTNLIGNVAISNWIGTGLGFLCRVGIISREFGESLVLNRWFGRSIASVVLLLAIVFATSTARYIWKEWDS